jgi:RNA polymerase sigma-70 factor (ECF subfamily)
MTNVDLDGETALVARLKAGEGDAFDELYGSYHLRLFNFLARLTRRRDVAEELAEELWLRVVTAAPRLRDDTRLAPWLFTIARNIHASYCRARLVPFDALDEGAVWPIPSPDPSPFEAAVATQLQQRVEVALAALPGRYREALLLVAVEGFSPAEAALVCGVSPETMRQRLSRGRAALAERLEVERPRRSPVLNEVLP